MPSCKGTLIYNAMLIIHFLLCYLVYYFTGQHLCVTPILRGGQIYIVIRRRLWQIGLFLWHTHVTDYFVLVWWVLGVASGRLWKHHAASQKHGQLIIFKSKTCFVTYYVYGCNNIKWATFVDNVDITDAYTWASYQIRKTVGCACAGNAGNFFPDNDFKLNR